MIRYFFLKAGFDNKKQAQITTQKVAELKTS